MLTSSAGGGEDAWKFSTDLRGGFDMGLDLEKTAGSREHLDLSLSY